MRISLLGRTNGAAAGPLDRMTSGADFSRAAAELALIGIFILALAAFLSFARSILLPVTAAVIVGTILARPTALAARHGIPRWVTAGLLLLAILVAAAFVVVIASDPVSEWIRRAPEIGARLRERLAILEEPLAALEHLRAALAAPGAERGDPLRVQIGTEFLASFVRAVTPAVGELLVFFGTLFFFLVGRIDLRTYLASLPSDRRERLRVLHALGDIEERLASYLVTVTVVNAILGLVTAAMLYAIGFPNPGVWGAIAFVLNYVAYLGPALTAAILFAVGMVSFPGFWEVLIAPALFLAITTLEGQFITPAVMGRRLIINPLAVFLSIGVWTWLWGPFGALLATPILIVMLVALENLRAANSVEVPG
jgi:predicted PurR-regulated permease PerM